MGSVPFANNWAYLDTELSWLERLLLVAVSQQRKNLKSVTKVAKTTSDKVTSDWWQGLVTIKNRAYDDAAPKPSSGPSLGYQKTLDQRILLSRASKVSLGLPAMQTALGLSLFEKKLVLMALAPEVQVRYGKLYHYLQTGAHCARGSLPTVELALRLLCRNESERRRARTRLTGPESLLKRRIVHCLDGADTFLGSQLQLAPEWVDYLLAENPDPGWPMRFVVANRFAYRCRQQVSWPDLSLPEPVQVRLEMAVAQPASRLLLVGETGVGKEQAAIALASQLKRPLYILELSQIPHGDWDKCLQELQDARHPMVLVKAAHHWLGRHASMDRALLQKWFDQSSAHILCTVQHRHLVRRQWRQQFTAIEIPRPNADVRLRLWHQGFPGGVKSMGKVRWRTLAEKLELLPGEIDNIVQTTISFAMAADAVTIDHLQQALAQHGYSWKLR
ncbi:ATP-binding protein [Leptothoe kymatousa]|uniref:Winged helix domain-containing protein n=1 Tax=Leptothoe kymatousa TAU-MAC 1615 TaxID=2364775 RepID=A0ABS5Y2Q5_9CYAN|nr:hypothetical protein [Leptothoe kymatousa]MBT9312129.1 hypothetical protein [Leptothoe kymatousa TAU-MAC 1615]